MSAPVNEGLRRLYRPRTHKRKATGKNRTGYLRSEEVWKTRRADDCTSPKPCPSRDCDAENFDSSRTLWYECCYMGKKRFLRVRSQ